MHHVAMSFNVPSRVVHLCGTSVQSCTKLTLIYISCVVCSYQDWLVQAYPPPVAGGAPSATNTVFSDMNSEQWDDFMLELTHLIDLGLKDGRWRQDVKKGKGTHAMQNMGVSCPRF